MAQSNITLQGALQKLDVTATTETETEIQVAGQTPREISSHTIEKTYNLLGKTPEEFIKEHGSTTFELTDLISQFSGICLDYLEELTLDGESKAVEFCSKILYEVGPESRSVKRGKGDKVWKFNFIYVNNGIVDIRVALVCTFKESDNNFTQTKDKKKMVLTVKQASLLAIITLEKINTLSIGQEPPILLLTPLAGAVFSKDDIFKISEKLDYHPSLVLHCINASCQSGGQYLPSSRLHTAAVAAIVATRNIKDSNMRDSIIGKTIKQYLAQKKPWDETRFMIYSVYANGGVPSYLKPEILIKLWEESQKVKPTQAIQLSKSTKISSIVSAPSGSKKKRSDRAKEDAGKKPDDVPKKADDADK